MPKIAKKKAVAPIAQASPEPVAEVPTPPTQEVVYDKLEITEYSTTSLKGPFTIERMKRAMFWETEKEWQARKVSEEVAKGNIGARPEHFLFGEGVLREDGRMQPIHCRDLSGQKVICWNNANNRSFDSDWAEALVQTVLSGQWAGPFTIPGETVNGETVRISRYGNVLSGQHQITAAVTANDKLQKARAQLGREEADKKYPTWANQEEVFLETIVITGMSEDARVMMTVDYVKPRTAADVFYTSEVFHENTTLDRKELCRMLASATDFLWTRTDTRGYRTHPEVVAFLERHKRLLKCVMHLFSLNSTKAERKISKLRLQPGVSAAILFLQGCSGPKTDGDVYRNQEPPTENFLDWSLWDHADEFWRLLADGGEFELVCDALASLMDSSVDNEDNQGLGGRAMEKLALVSKAWDRWKDFGGNGEVFTDEDLALSYSTLDDNGNKLPPGEVKLLDIADFGGIDCPEAKKVGKKVRASPPMPVEMTPEEFERAKEDAQARRQKAGK